MPHQWVCSSSLNFCTLGASIDIVYAGCRRACSFSYVLVVTVNLLGPFVFNEADEDYVIVGAPRLLFPPAVCMQQASVEGRLFEGFLAVPREAGTTVPR